MYLKRDFFKNVLKVGGAAILAQLVGILTAPIFARLFSPEVVGQYTLFISLIGIFGVFATLRYEAALMLPKENEVALNILVGSGCIALIYSLFLFVLIYTIGPFLYEIGDYSSIKSYILLIPIFVLVSSWIKLLQYWIIRKKTFDFNAKLTVFYSVGVKVGNVSLGFLGFVSNGALILIYMFFQLLELVMRILNILKSDINRFFATVNVKQIWSILVRYKRFPLIDVWNGFLDTGSLLIVPILLSFYFSSSDVGLYSQSLNLVQLPLTLIAYTFGQVIFQRLSEAKHTGELAPVVAESFIFLLLISVPIFTVVFFWGREIFSFFLGRTWAISGVYAELLAPWCCLKMAFSPLSTIFGVTERQDLSLIITITTIMTRVLAIVIGGIYNSCYLAILLFGISGVVVNLIGTALLFYVSNMKWQYMQNAFTNNVFFVILRKI
ncbi:lipopolysaccharide biosynthesis protein [Butyricimonas sp. Marseille-P3923]|uniref:lipopolysaccharide biosynthesis protein n=1 Tax=Butyricimonas sp. Marseille-P3923 TaxID=1987504 RepID=UPI000C087788|nr:oligosaccharide flippase family protein [Butyricimonas sp. Marseille-P3923]